MFLQAQSTSYSSDRRSYEEIKKDLAFDKERARFRSEIRQLKGDIQSKDMQIRDLMNQIGELERKIQELEDWNNRLLEYMDMSEEDMRRVLRDKDIESQVIESIRNIVGIICGRKI